MFLKIYLKKKKIVDRFVGLVHFVSVVFFVDVFSPRYSFICDYYEDVIAFPSYFQFFIAISS